MVCEKVLWSGRPQSMLHVWEKVVMQGVLSTICLIMIMNWLYPDVNKFVIHFSWEISSLFDVVFSSVYILFQLIVFVVFLGGPLLFEYADLRLTSYVVTDKGVVIVKRFPFYRSKKISFSAIKLCETESALGGLGHVYFEPKPAVMSFMANSWPRNYLAIRMIFFFVPDSDHVCSLVRSRMIR
jgi:hypothetical protein